MPVTHPVNFTPAARYELLDAQDWYENEVEGLGQRFRAEVSTAVERIQANPHQFPLVYRNVRRAVLRRFPYLLMFLIEPDDSLTVVACFHGSRNPVRWHGRL
ncbi:type II toxin-antitoxin system RelE/ParE family toxin [Acidobacterium sp.]|uniref:Plasmid stabilization system protein, RelE/ParE family n=1 Tax=Acidobacterium capsulatum (strain ATCC 51196 / DSM 11244 / BCRC 80197 / JCM 7670 / NBRC 15755 / NCIMB 13165 / 161) TaxID=240015 RepID=C1F807_ACIC5|nr:plasmid stabilization system protein, RelE/ParE family [Acidobacterium capsulatum ATCC 51196]HCT59297.1 type II toxin-antitoxin system RelE/ParE family toxin [Acidobacterium sp.]